MLLQLDGSYYDMYVVFLLYEEKEGAHIEGSYIPEESRYKIQEI